MSFQAAKSVVRAHYAALARATEASVVEALSAHTTASWQWRGVHPFNTQSGPGAVADAFWRPLIRAFSRLQRREDIFFAGKNEIDGFETTWVVSM